MPTFQTLYNRYLDLTGNNSTANKTLGKSLINDTQRMVLADRTWPFMTVTSTDTTATSTQGYALPYNVDKTETVTITVDDVDYQPEYISDIRAWRDLNARSTDVTSEIPEYYTIINNEVHFWPTPSDTGNTITYTYQKRFRDLTADDYTTGTVTATNGSATLTGSGTSWNGNVTADQRVKVDNDGYWYEISDVATNTAITLQTKFGGTTASGASYTVGDWSPIPETYHDLLVHRAVGVFYQQRENTNMATYYLRQYEIMLKKLSKNYDTNITKRSGRRTQHFRKLYRQIDPNKDRTATHI